jgi:hypothetical protein
MQKIASKDAKNQQKNQNGAKGDSNDVWNFLKCKKIERYSKTERCENCFK